MDNTVMLIIETYQEFPARLQGCYNSMSMDPWVRTRPTTSPQRLRGFGQPPYWFPGDS